MGEGKGCTCSRWPCLEHTYFRVTKNQQQKGLQERSEDREQQGEEHRPQECRVWRELRAGSWLLQGKDPQNWE